MVDLEWIPLLLLGPSLGLIWFVHAMKEAMDCCLLTIDMNPIHHSCSRLEAAAKKE
jgi:hypothetical protein